MTGGYADYAVPGQIADGVNHRLARNAFPEILESRRIEAPLLDPILREIDLRYRDGAATAFSVNKCHRARFGTADSDGVRSSRNDTNIEDDAGKVVEAGGKKMRAPPAGSTIDLSFRVNIECGDSALVVGDWSRHAGQARGERDHRALAHKLVRKRLLICFYGWRIRIESAFCLHDRNLL